MRLVVCRVDGRLVTPSPDPSTPQLTQSGRKSTSWAMIARDICIC